MILELTLKLSGDLTRVPEGHQSEGLALTQGPGEQSQFCFHFSLSAPQPYRQVEGSALARGVVRRFTVAIGLVG